MNERLCQHKFSIFDHAEQVPVMHTPCSATLPHMFIHLPTLAGMFVRRIAACCTADDIDTKLIALVTIPQQEAGCKFEFALQQALPATSEPSSENQTQLPLHTSPTAFTAGFSEHGQAAAHQTKRQKVEQLEIADSKPAAQQLHEARSVAAATKQHLGLTGNTC